MRAALAALLLCLAGPAAALARPGAPDVTIASGGRTAFRVGTGSAHVAGLALRPDGRALVAGTAVPAGGGLATSVAQLGPAGVLDPAFGSDGLALLDPVAARGARPAGIALQHDGGVIAVTNVHDGAIARDAIHVLRLAPDGRPDPAFGTDGVVALADPAADLRAGGVAIDTRGRILIATSTHTGSKQLLSAYRLLADGRPDPHFATDGRIDLVRRAIAGAVVPRPGGGAVLVGSSTSPHGGLRVSAFSRHGHRLDRFGHGLIRTPVPDTTGVRTTIAGAARGPDGTILVAASTGRSDSRRWIVLARYTSRGRLDARFGQDGLAVPGGRHRRLAANAMIQDGAGRILLAGSVRTGTPRVDAAVLRTNRHGALTRRFGRRGVVVRRLGGAPGVRFSASQATGIALTRPRRVVVGGIAYAASAARRGWAAVMWLHN